MAFGNFQREERKSITPGDYRVVIVDAEQTVSKTSGKDMLVITVQPNGSDIKIKQYIVDNQYFNQNMTQFFDSFNVPFGDFNLPTWKGAIGAARLVLDENEYLRVKFFIHRDKQGALPPWEGQLPERQAVTTLGAPVEDDELPFD
ncbi:MAG: DUF669 domain-containing protein [Clostridiaceae bacterium]|nr:DUF669 domain-containing protein [Clostridiaceae bacterium]